MALFYINEIKKVKPQGPYSLLGTCFSNAVALEMANQLQAIGDEIDLLIFVDSGPQYLLGLAERGGKRTLFRFSKMIKEQNWGGIEKKIRNRYIRLKRKAFSITEKEEEKNLRITIDNLNELYKQYTWIPFNGKVTLIRSTEFANRKDKNIHLTQWKKLALGGLEVHVVEGHHTTLFDEPEVEGLATVIESCIKRQSLS